MQIIQDPEAMQQLARELRAEGRRTGLVPTMGSLHKAHESLFTLAKSHAEALVVSIFVNPTQFAKGEDFKNYPKSLEKDLETCRKHGAAAVFTPQVEHLYPSGFSTWIEETSLTQRLCGASRPGHFKGVATIVGMLFNLCTPDVAVFGQKDAQQLAMIQKMNRELYFNIKIIEAPALREADGLVISSRNQNLNAEERREAPKIYQALRTAIPLVHSGVSDAEHLRGAVAEKLSESKIIEVIYLEIVHIETLKAQKNCVAGKSLLAGAFRLGKTRLIDNIRL